MGSRPGTHQSRSQEGISTREIQNTLRLILYEDDHDMTIIPLDEQFNLSLKYDRSEVAHLWRR